MTSAPSTRFRHVLQRVGKPVAWLSALALAVGGVTVAQQFQGADEAEALYPPTSGTGDKKLSVGVTWSTNAVYVAVSASDRVARFTTNSDGLITSNALTTVATMGRAWTGAGTAANGAESMALDGGEFTGTPMAYFWGWNAYEGDIYGGSAPATSGDIQVQAFPNGAVNSYAFRILQPSGTGSGGTYDYWSGGEVIQRTGEIFFSGGECNRINGSYRMMIVDPGTKAYRASGLLSPASASDHLWGSSTGNTCTDTALGRVASDMALDGYGNAYILVQGQAAAGSQWAPNGVSVRHIYLVRVVPGANLSGWKYNIVQVLQAAPGASSDVYAWTGTATGASNMDFVFGMAFLNGHLYATRGTGLTPSTADLMRIDPLSGLVYHVPENSIADVSPAPYDLASGQTAYVTAGQVFNDVNANGVREADEPGLANQIITLYKENAAGAWVWLGTRQTSGTGDYSFIVSGQGTYHVRLVQPKIGGVNAVQTYASSGESPPSSRGLNTVSAQCYDYGTETVVPLTASGVCRGALPVPYSDAGSAGSLGGILSALDQVAIHSTMVLTNAYDIPAADFGVTALGSFGDAGTGPATVAAAAPVHVTGLTPSIFLGSVQGSYTAPATDNAAHNASDDGVYMQAYNGARIPLNQVGVLAAQRTYDNLKAQVSGDLAGSADAQVQGWITSPVASGNGAWAAAPSWTPTISSGVASGGFIPSTVNTLLATPQYVNMRVAVSTQATTVPTNASNQYQSTGGSPWVTNGEIEDYRYQVADAAYRVAAQSNGGTGTFTVDGQSLTTVASATVYGVGSGLAAGSAKTVTVTLPNASWQVDHVEVRDTSDGALVASPVYNENTATSGTFSFTPALSQDLTALVVFTKAPDPVKSELSLSAATATVGADITATATVKTAEDVLLPNVTVRFQAATDLVVHAGQSSQPVSQCTTNIDGVCSVLVTSSVAASYSNGLVAQVWTDNAWRDLTGSPASLAFTADAGRPGSSQLVVSPAGPLVVGSSSANTYALTTTIRDGSNNLVPGAEVTFSVDGVDGSPIDAGLGGLSALTAQTGSDGVASVTFTSTKPGSFRLHAQIPNPEAGNVLTDVGGSDPTLSSPQVRVFNPAPTRGDVSAFVVAPLNNLLGETAVATVTLKDGYENAIPGRSQASLNIATGCSVASDFAEIGNGVYTFNLTVTGTVACEDTVTVTPDVGVTLQQTVRWAVPQPTETYSDLVLSHSSQTVGQNVVATVTVRDQHDRPITGLTAAQVVLSSDPTDVTITGFRALTAAGDEGKYEWDLTSTVSGLKTITAVVSGVTFNAAVRQVTFTADVPTELNSSFRITPASLQVQGVALASLVVRDQYGNGVPDVAPTLNYGALTRLSGPTAGTGPGTGLYTWFLTTSTAGDYTVTATVPVPGDDDIVLTDTVSFVAGDITGLDFDYSPASVPVSDSAGATMVGAGQVFDDQNNAVRGLTLDDFELTYRQVADPDDSTTWVASTDVQVVPGSFAEDASGNYSFDVYSQVAGSYEVTVAVHGVEQLLDYLVTFTAETPDQDGASLSITPDPSYVGTEAQMALTVTDRFDNPVPGLASGLTVAPSSDYSPVGAWVEQFDQYGASTGVYHRGLTSDSSGTHTVSVTVPASPSALTVTDDITFQYAMGGTVTLSFNAGPHYVSEQAGATAVATVNVLDANNQPITNLLDADFDFDFDADVHLVPGSFANLSNGNYSYSLYSTVADTYDIEVGLDLVGSDSESLTFLPTEPDDTNTSFVIDPATQVPGSSVTGTVTVKDAFGNPISGLTAAGFDLDADGLTVVSGPTADAGTPGDYTYVFSSNVTNVYDPTVTVGQVTKTAQVEYLFGSVDPAFSDVTVNPAQQVVDQTVGITVTVRDSSPGHNLINNLTQADFEITAASQTAGAPDRGASFVSNNNDGTYTFSVTSQLIGQFAVQATVLGSLLDDHPVITFTASGVCVNNCHPIDPTHRTRVEMTANDQLSDGSHQDKAVLYAYDTNGNPVKDAQVVAQAAAGNTNLTPQTNNATTGPDGTAELAWTSLVQGTYTATVTADGLTPAVGGVLSQIRFSQTQPASTVLTVTPSGPLTVGGTYTAEVQVRDAQSTPLEGINISFSALVSSSGEPNPSASLSEQTCQTGLNGRCSITVTSQIAGVYNVNATVPIDGVATPATDSPTPITFNPGPVCVQDCQPVDPTRVTRVEVTKNGQPPSGVDEATLHAHDTYGNAVSGATVTTSTTDSGLTVLTPNVQTAADGSAVLQYTSVVAGAHPAQVRVDSQTPNGSPVSLVFVSNPGDPGQSFLTATPAGPLAAGGMYTITATVLDSTGLNRVNGIPISFTGQSGLTFVNGVDSCETAGSGATAGTCSVLVTSRLAGSYQVGATMPDSGGVTQSLNNSPIEVEFVASTICITGCDPIDPTHYSHVEIIKNGADFNGVDHDIVRVFAYDYSGNPVSGAAVSAATTDADLTVQPTIDSTGPDGVSTVWFASTVAGPHDATVTVGGLPAGGWPVTLAFGEGKGDPDHSSFAIVPDGPLVVGDGAANTYTVTATVNDIFDSPVTGAVVAFTVTPAVADGPVFGGGQDTCTTVSGTCQVTLSSTKSGTYAIGAELSSGAIGTAQTRAWQADEVCAQSAGCTPVDPTSPRTRVEVEIDNQLADGSTPDIALLYAYDKWGNPVPSVLVESATTDSALTILPGTEGTNEQGQSRIRYTSTVAGAHEATVTVQGKTPNGSPITLNFKPGPISPDTTSWAIDPVTQVPGNTVTGTLTVKDELGNPVDGIPAGDISLVPDGLTVVSGPTAQGDGQYTYVFNATAADTYDPEVTVRGVVKTASVTYGYGEIDASASTVVISPTEQRAGQNIQVIITVKDVSASHNPIPDLAPSAFTVTATSQTAGAPDLTGSFVSNNNDGTYTFNISSRLVGQFAVQATVQSVLLANHPVASFIAGGVCVTNCTPVDPTHVTRLEMIQNDQLSDGSSPDKARAYAYDTYGNAVNLAQVRAQAAAGNAALTPQINQAQTGPDGTAELAWTSLTPGVYTATATIDGLEPATGVLSAIRFNQTQPDPDQSTLTVTPDSPITVGNSYTARVEVRDAQGTPLAGVTASFSALVSSSSEPNPVASLSQQTCYTGLNGTCSITVTSQIAGVYAVTATVPVQGQATNVQNSPAQVAFTPGPVCVSNCQNVDPTRHTRVEVTRNGQPPNGVDEAMVYAHDTYGNAVSDVVVTTSTTDPTLTVQTPNVQTGPNGSAVLRFTSAVAGAHPAQVTVASQAITGSPVTLNFVEGDVDPSQSFLTVTPTGSLAAGGLYTVTATVLDSTGLNRVNGVPISFSGQSDLTFVNGLSTCTTAGVGSTAGTCSVQVSSKVAASYQVGATMPDTSGVSRPLSNSPVTVSFIAGPICVTNCTPIDPADVTRAEVITNGAAFDGNDHDVVRVYAYDTYGNPVSDAAVASTTSDADLFIQPAGTIQPTGANGTVTVWYASTVAGDHSANVTVGGLTPNGSPVTLGFGSGTGDPSRSSYTIAPAGPLVVGTEAVNTYTITATVNDVFGAPVIGEVVTFKVDPAGPVFGGNLNSCTTAAGGTCQVTLSSTKSGTYSITANLKAGPIGTGQSRAWQADEVCAQSAGCIPVDPNSPRTRVEVTLDDQPADGSTPDKAILYAYDKWGNPVPGALVESVTTDSDLTIQPSIPGTNDQGQSEILYTSTVAGAHQATLTVQGKTPTGSPITLNFKPDQISAANTTWVIEPSNQIPGNPVTGTLTVQDAQHNPIDGIPAGEINLIPGGLTVVSGPTAQSDGQYVYELTATQTNTYDTELTVRGVTKTASVTYGYAPIDANASTVAINPAEQTAGQNIQVIVTVKDSSASHNPIPNLDPSAFTVTATSQTPGAPDLTGSFVSNNNDGTYTFYISSRLVGQFAVQATVSSVLLSQHPVASFKAGGVCVTNCTPVDPTHVTRVEMTDNDQLSNGSDQDKARVYAYDTYGNAVNLAQVRAQAAAGNAALTPQINLAQTGTDGTAELAWTSLVQGTYTATVTIDGLSPATAVLSQINFTQTQPDPTLSRLTVTPASPIQVNGSYTARVEVKDANGTALEGVRASFAAPVSSSTEPNPVATLSSTSCITGVNGTCSITVSSRIAGSYAITATVPVQGQATAVVDSPTTVAFIPGSVCVSNPNPVDPTRLTRVEVTRDGQPPNGVDQATVYAYDCDGNAVANAAVVTDTTDPALTVQTPSALTGVDGTTVLAYTSAVAGPHLANVRVAGLTPSGSPVTLNFVADPGDPNHSVLSVSPASPIVVDGVYTVTATVYDSTGLNRVNGIPITFDGPGLTFVGGVRNCTTAGTGASAGTCSVQVTSQEATTYQVHAYMPDDLGVTRELSNSPVEVAFTAGPICVTACQDQVHSTRVEIIKNGADFNGVDRDIVRVYAYDTYGNPVPDAVVGSSTSDVNLQIQPSADIAKTAADGTSTIWYTSSVAGNHYADVRVGGLTPNGSPVTLGFGANTGYPPNSSFAIDPVGPLTVGTGPANTYTITATVNDIFGDPVTGEVVTFTVDPAGPVWGSGGLSCITDEGSCQVTLSSTVSGTYSINAQIAAGYIGTALPRAWQADEVCAQLNGCTPVDPTSSRTRVEVTKDGRVADGSTPDEATVYAYDKWGNPVPGALVESATTDADLRIVPGTYGTNELGQSIIQYTSLKAGPHQATVQVQGKTPTGSPITLNFVPDQICVSPTCQDPNVPNEQRTRIVVDPDGQEADGVTRDVANVYIFDGHGNPVPGAVVTQSTTDPDLLVQAGSIDPTDANGRTTIWYASAVAGPHTAHAFVEVAGVPVEIVFTPKDPAPLNFQSSPFLVTFDTGTVCFQPSCQDPGVPFERRSHIEVDPDGVEADGVSLDIANVYLFDGHGNPVVGAKVTGSTSDPNLTAQANDSIALTNSDGRTTIWYTSTEAGSHTAQAFYMDGGSAIPIRFPATPADSSLGQPPAGYQSSPFQVSFISGGICLGQDDCQNPEVPFERRSRIEVQPDDQVADGQSQDIANVYIFDGNGNPIQGAVVTQSKTDVSLNVQTTPITVTDANGRSTIAYSSLLAGQHTAHAFVEVNGVPTEVAFPATPADPSLGQPPADYQSSPFRLNFVPDDACLDPATGCQDPNVPFDQRSRVEVVPDGQIADGQTQDVANVYVFDGHGNPIVGATVTQSKTDTTLTAQANADIAATDAAGHSTIWYTSRVADGHTARAFVDVNGVATEIKFSATPADPSLGQPPADYQSSPFTVSFVAGPICTDPSCQNPDVENDKRTRVVVYPDRQTADGLARDVANVYIFDGEGNPIENATVTQAHSDLDLTVQPASIDRTDANGRTTIWYSTTVAGDHTAQAFVRIDGVDTEINFIGLAPAPANYQSSPFQLNFQAGPPCFDETCQNPGVPEDKRSRIEVVPDGQIADGVEHDIANVYIFDGEGNPVPGVTVQQQHNNIDLISQANADIAVTDANGRSTIWYATTVAGSYTAQVYATVNGQPTEVVHVPAAPPNSGRAQSSPFTMEFVAGPPCVGACVPDETVPNDRRSRIMVDPDRQNAGGAGIDQANIYLFDQWGNPTVGQVVRQIPVSTSLQLTTTPEPFSDNTGWATYGYASIDDGRMEARAFVLVEGTPVEITFVPQPNSAPPISYQSSPYFLTFVDRDAPPAPSITSPADGALIQTNLPEVSGLDAEPGSTVVVTSDGTAICQTTAGADGSWSCTPSVALSEGQHTLEASSTDAAGNTSPISTGHLVTVDTVAPPAPSVTAPADGSDINDPTPEFAGTGTEPGNQIEVVDTTTGDVICSTTVEPDGSWSCVADQPLSEGSHSVEVTETDAAGNASPTQDITFEVDVTAPGTPSVGSPADGSVTNDDTPEFSGTGDEPGNQIDVTDADTGDVICSAQVQPDGTWSCTPSTPLDEGVHVVEVTETDPAGNSSPPDEITFEVDITEPTTPIVTKPSQGESVNSEAPEFAGTGEPGTVVSVTDQDSGDVLCSTTVGQDGHWVCESDTNLADGDHTVVVTQQDPAGNTSPGQVVDFNVDTEGPTPAITSPTEGQHVNQSRPMVYGIGGQPGDTVVITANAGNACVTAVTIDSTWFCQLPQTLPDGDVTIRAVVTDPAGNEGTDRKDIIVDTVRPNAPIVTEPGDGESISDDQPTVSGEGGEPGGQIDVDAGDGNACSAIVQADGTWTCQLPIPLPDGPVRIEVTETDQAGNVSEPTVIEPIVDTVAPAPVVVVSPTPGQWINDATPESSGTAEPGTIVTVDAGSGNRCTVTVDLQGEWACSLPDPLPDGPGKIVVTSTDAAGNTSDPIEVLFTVDTVSPAAPTVEGDEKGLDGTGEPGDVIRVEDKDGDVLCEAEIGPDGRWSCVPQGPVQPGDIITVIEIDQAGNTAETEYMIPVPVPTGADYGLPFIVGSGLAALLGAFFILLGWRRRRDDEEGTVQAA